MTALPRLVVLLLLSAVLMPAAAVPRMKSVEPDVVAPGGEAVAAGMNLDSASVDKLFLTADGKDIEVSIAEQSADSIRFTIPAKVEKKSYRLMVQTGGAVPALMEQPVAIEVVDEATAKERAGEESQEVEIVDTPNEPAP